MLNFFLLLSFAILSLTRYVFIGTFLFPRISILFTFFAELEVFLYAIGISVLLCWIVCTFVFVELFFVRVFRIHVSVGFSAFESIVRTQKPIFEEFFV